MSATYIWFGLNSLNFDIVILILPLNELIWTSLEGKQDLHDNEVAEATYPSHCLFQI